MTNFVRSFSETYSVTVTVRSYMGEELSEGAIEEVTFKNAEAACSNNLYGFKVPRKLKMRPKKRFVIRRFQ